jgi:hypothetical protein
MWYTFECFLRDQLAAEKMSMSAGINAENGIRLILDGQTFLVQDDKIIPLDKRPDTVTRHDKSE